MHGKLCLAQASPYVKLRIHPELAISSLDALELGVSKVRLQSVHARRARRRRARASNIFDFPIRLFSL